MVPTDDQENQGHLERPAGMVAMEQTALQEYPDDKDHLECRAFPVPPVWTARKVNRQLDMLALQEKRETEECLVCQGCLDHREEMDTLEKKEIEEMSDQLDRVGLREKLEYQVILVSEASDRKETQETWELKVLEGPPVPLHPPWRRER